jgi:hypothetical protein
MGSTSHGDRGKQIARRREQLAAGQRPTQDDVRRAAEHNEDAYDSAAAAHDLAAEAFDRAAARGGPDQATNEAAASKHRYGRDADTNAGAAARTKRAAAANNPD